MAAVEIRRATVGDCEAVAELCALLWPDGSLQEHAAELREKSASGMSGTLPVTILVAADVESGAHLIYRKNRDDTRATKPLL
jgi:hypothetical protein